MNKQELIESISHLPSDCSGQRPMIDKLTALELIKLLDEPQKVQVPQFVADWIKKIKKELSMREAMSQGHAPHEVDSWLREMDQDGACLNQELFARAWLDGYEVEKEKRYYVRFKGMESGDFNYLNFIKFQHAWTLSSIKLDKKFRTEHTKKELEDAGFGWVFDCEGMEVKEVEEEK